MKIVCEQITFRPRPHCSAFVCLHIWRRKHFSFHSARFSNKQAMNMWKCSHCTRQIRCFLSHFQTNIFIQRILSYLNVPVFGVHTENGEYPIRTVFKSMRIYSRIRTAPYLKRIHVNATPKLKCFASFSFKYGAVWTTPWLCF